MMRRSDSLMEKLLRVKHFRDLPNSPLALEDLGFSVLRHLAPQRKLHDFRRLHFFPFRK